MTPCSERTLGSPAAMVTSNALLAVDRDSQHAAFYRPSRPTFNSTRGDSTRGGCAALCNGRNMLKRLTGILGIMQSSGQDLKGACKVGEVESGLQGEEHINGLISHCRRLVGHLERIVDVIGVE